MHRAGSGDERREGEEVWKKKIWLLQTQWKSSSFALWQLRSTHSVKEKKKKTPPKSSSVTMEESWDLKLIQAQVYKYSDSQTESCTQKSIRFHRKSGHAGSRVRDNSQPPTFCLASPLIFLMLFKHPVSALTLRAAPLILLTEQSWHFL